MYAHSNGDWVEVYLKNVNDDQNENFSEDDLDSASEELIE